MSDEGVKESYLLGIDRQRPECTCGTEFREHWMKRVKTQKWTGEFIGSAVLRLRIDMFNPGKYPKKWLKIACRMAPRSKEKVMTHAE